MSSNHASPMLDSKTPSGNLKDAWTNHKFNLPLINPANRRKFKILVVGTGLAGSSAAATLAEMGYEVQTFCIQDSPRRAHSIAAQGGINAAKNYKGDGDSIHRLFYDTVKGRRLPRPGAQRAPFGRGQRRHHRSMCCAGRALRTGIRRTCWTHDPLVEPRSRAPFTPGAKPGNNCC